MIFVECVVKKQLMRGKSMDLHLDWCDENVPQDDYYAMYGGIMFINECDAVAFKLKFGL